MKKSAGLLLLIASISTLALRSAQPESPQTIQFTAKVVSGDGQPVSGAVLEFYQYPTVPVAGRDAELKQRETANSDGVVQVQIPKTYVHVMARKEGWAPSWLSMYNRAIATADHKIVLTQPTNFVGIVMDEANKPVANAEVWVANANIEGVSGENRRFYHWLSGSLARDAFSTRTGADGRFQLTGFPTNATAYLAARAPGKVLREPQTEYFRPETMSRPGPREIKLVLEPGGGLEGKVLAADTDHPLPGVKLWLQRQRAGAMLTPEPAESAKDGTFVFRDVAAGAYRVHASFGTNQPPDWVAEDVATAVEVGQTNRDIVVTAIRGGFLEVAVFDDQHKPLAGANVNAYRESQGSGAISSSAGLALLRLPPGQYQVSAYKENLRAEQTSATVENNSTNRVEIQFKPRPKVAGKVTDPEGQPVAGISLLLFPDWGAPSDTAVKTDAQGHFELFWDPQQHRMPDQTMSLIVRNTEKNLAVARDLDENTSTLDLQLQPGLIITGRVEDLEGHPLTNGTVSLTLWSGNMGSQFGDQPKTDSDGRFKVTCLPSGRKYSLNASAPGYGSSYQQVHEAEGETNAVELAPFVLRVADRDLAGQVLDEQEKPAVGASVSIQGEGQPFLHMIADQAGRFTAKVCEGRVRLWASAQNSYCNASVEAGETNITLQLRSSSSSDRMARRRASLKGQPLPDLAPLGLSTNAAAAAGPLLICLFDCEQRPSRRFIRTLAEQHEAILKKSLVVLAAQARVTTAESIQTWKESSPSPFPVGQLVEKTPAGKWVTEIETLPWLILTDAKRTVVAEGFGLDDLDSMIEALGK